LHCCNKYFKLYGCELLFTWAFVYSIIFKRKLEIAIGIVIEPSVKEVINTNLLLFANGVQFNSSSKSKV
jgi:hypothetical protein